MDSPYLATIVLWSGIFIPQGWFVCDGRLLQISAYQALYTLLGTVFGGNGVQTFGLPDLRGRVPLGVGLAASGTMYNAGNHGGEETVTLVQSQMPIHNHLMNGSTSTLGTVSSPSNAFPGEAPATTKIYAPTQTSGVTMNAQAITTAGGSQPHQNMQPYLAINYIIAVEGLYPPRP